MPFGGRVLEARGLWCSVSERGGRVWKSSVLDRERAREEVRGGEYQRGFEVVVYSLGTRTARFWVHVRLDTSYIVPSNCLLIK